MITLEPTESDDAQFVALVAQLLNGLLRHKRPQEVYAVQIDLVRSQMAALFREGSRRAGHLEPQRDDSAFRSWSSY